MFKDEIWKGILGLLCGLYMLYYAIFEYDHENKWIIVLTALAGGAIASALNEHGNVRPPSPTDPQSHRLTDQPKTM